jgi:AcrR family transcriptional regulator
LAVGVREFAHGTYAEVSTERIAEQAGVAQGLLFHYFKTKRGFWEEVMGRIFDEQEAAFTANTDRDPVRWLHEELELFLYGLVEYPPSMMTSASGFDRDHRAIVETRQDRAAQRLIRRMGITEPSPLLTVAVRGWVALSLGAGRRWLQTPAVSRAQVLGLLTDTLHGTLEHVADVEPGSVDPKFFRPPGSVDRALDA